jgi:exopolysaccharide production protein ExoF
VDGEISALALKIATQRGLVQEAALYSGAAMPGDVAPTYAYTILRGSEEIAAEPTTPLQAGDVVTARLHLTGMGDQP